MKVVIFSDIQFRNNASFSYVQDNGLSSWLNTQIDIVNGILWFAEENGYVVIHNGDLFEDKTNINVVVFDAVWNLFRKYIDLGIILNTGNHDFIRKIDGSILSSFSPICTVVANRYRDFESFRVIPFNGITDKNIIPNKKINTLFTHESIQELSLGNSNFSLPNSYPKSLFKDWNWVFNGHIHKPQQVDNIISIGSPMQQDFSEEGQEHGFILYDLNTYKIERIPTNHPQFITLDFTEENIQIASEDEKNYYRLTIDPTQLEHSIFQKWNVKPYTVKSKDRKLRISSKPDITEEEELVQYIKIKNPKLNVSKLLEKGKEISGGRTNS